ncbi:MAG: type IV toxin-antitoxin system AbiEi family antitoxin domain-containing protein [Solirubrobacterales bacterium]
MAQLATRQHGVVALAQLAKLGFGVRAVERRLRDGRLHKLHRNVYAVGHTRVSQHGFWWAAVLAYGDESLLSHRSAAALWGLARRRAGAIDVTAPLGRQGPSRRDGIWIHRGRLHTEDGDERAGIPVTSVARTLFDYAEVVDFQRLERAWEETDRLKLLRLREVERVCERGYGRRALKPIRRLLAETQAVTRTRSPLEDRFQRFCRFYDLPAHSTNVEVLGKEVDVLWPAAKLIVELDSWEFHSHRAAFQRDRARDTRLLVAGYRTARVTHDRLDKEATALAAEIRELLRAHVVTASTGEHGTP